MARIAGFRRWIAGASLAALLSGSAASGGASEPAASNKPLSYHEATYYTAMQLADHTPIDDLPEFLKRNGLQDVDAVRFKEDVRAELIDYVCFRGINMSLTFEGVFERISQDLSYAKQVSGIPDRPVKIDDLTAIARQDIRNLSSLLEDTDQAPSTATLCVLQLERAYGTPKGFVEQFGAAAYGVVDEQLTLIASGAYLSDTASSTDFVSKYQQEARRGLFGRFSTRVLEKVLLLTEAFGPFPEQYDATVVYGIDLAAQAIQLRQHRIGQQLLATLLVVGEKNGLSYSNPDLRGLREAILRTGLQHLLTRNLMDERERARALAEVSYLHRVVQLPEETR